MIKVIIMATGNVGDLASTSKEDFVLGNGKRKKKIRLIALQYGYPFK